MLNIVPSCHRSGAPQRRERVPQSSLAHLLATRTQRDFGGPAAAECAPGSTAHARAVATLAGGPAREQAAARRVAAAADAVDLGQSGRPQNASDGGLVDCARHHAALHTVEWVVAEYGRVDPEDFETAGALWTTP